MPEIRSRFIDEHDIDTVLAEDIDFVGDLYFEAPLMIRGKFKGTIKATGDLYVDENAVVNAAIEANTVSIKGKVFGNISAKERVELFNKALLEGDIVAPDVIMESGCHFNGICTMSTEDKK